MNDQAAAKQNMLQMFSGLLESHRVAEKVLRKRGAKLPSAVRERLYQDLAHIKRDIFEVRERLMRAIDESFAIVDRAEKSGDLETAQSLTEDAKGRLTSSIAGAGEQIKNLYDRLKQVADAAFDMEEKSLRGSH